MRHSPVHGGRMNKNSYIKNKERNTANELIKLDNARIGKLIKDKEDAITSTNSTLTKLGIFMIFYILVYAALFYIKQEFFENLIIGAIMPFLFSTLFYFANEIDSYKKEVKECDNEIFNLGKVLYANGNLDKDYIKEFEKQITMQTKHNISK